MFVSKMLLATYGCIPAFDQYVCKGMEKKPTSRITENMLRYVYNFALSYKKDLLAVPALGIAVEMYSGAEEGGCTLERKARPHGGTPV